MVAILMMSANIATLGLLKLKVLWNKGYDLPSCDQSLITLAFLWEKLS